MTLENARTAGERLFAQHGITGVRGDAEAGFPLALQYGLPKLEEGLLAGLSANEAGCAALHRGDFEAFRTMVRKTTCEWFTSAEAEPVIQRIQEAGLAEYY